MYSFTLMILKECLTDRKIMMSRQIINKFDFDIFGCMHDIDTPKCEHFNTIGHFRTGIIFFVLFFSHLPLSLHFFSASFQSAYLPRYFSLFLHISAAPIAILQRAQNHFRLRYIAIVLFRSLMHTCTKIHSIQRSSIE